MPNVAMLTDSYKFTHWKQYPANATNVYSYFESRGGDFPEVVFFGLQAIIKRYMLEPVTMKDVDDAEALVAAHLGNKALYNREGWEHLVRDHGGKLPVKIMAVPEGTPIPTHNVLMTVENTCDRCFWLTNWLETLLSQVWYPSTVATQSREAKKIIKGYLEMTGDPSLIDFKLHDFGFRGVSSVESAGMGGMAHLVNFRGTDTIRALIYARDYYGESMAGFSIPACYDDRTEIFTQRGFVLFSELLESDKVAEYSDSGEISFVVPLAVQCSMYSGKMIKFETDGDTGVIDLVVTPNHRVVRRSVARQSLEVFTAENIKFSQKNEIVQAGLAKRDIIGELNDIQRLKIAFQADGSFASHKEDYTGSRGGTIPIRFSLKKERKKKRLRKILLRLGWKYTEADESVKEGCTRFWISVPEEFRFEKNLEWVPLDAISSSWGKEFIEEAAEWDGTRKGNTIIYSSSNKSCTEKVGAVAVLSGYRSSVRTYTDTRTNRKPMYTVSICKATDSRGGQRIRKETIDYFGMVYCVSVPSGMIVVRRNGNVVVCGNSEHSTITSWGRENEVQAFENMLNQFGDGMVAVVSDSYNIFDACEHLWGEQLKDKVLSMKGNLVIRPDSGQPVPTIMRVLTILGDKFGYTQNAKGYKVLNPKVRIIQGDGVDLKSIGAILDAMREMGWSTDNIAFGMGGALLQRLNRDNLKFAFKCSAIKINGKWRDVYKEPITDPGKNSKRGRLELIRVGDTYATAKVDDSDSMSHPNGILQTVYENGELLIDQKFSDIRERAKI